MDIVCVCCASTNSLLLYDQENVVLETNDLGSHERIW